MRMKKPPITAAAEETAAQLWFFDNRGNNITLFETVYDPVVFKDLPDVDRGGQPVNVFARGMQVSLWVEKGLLMAAVKRQ